MWAKFKTNILAENYNETTDREELDLYFNVVKDYSEKQEIKLPRYFYIGLNNKLSNQKDYLYFF